MKLCWLLFKIEANSHPRLKTEKLHMNTLMLPIGNLNNGWASNRVDYNVTPKSVFTIIYNNKQTTSLVTNKLLVFDYRNVQLMVRIWVL